MVAEGSGNSGQNSSRWVGRCLQAPRYMTVHKDCPQLGTETCSIAHRKDTQADWRK